jgi:D-amino-acid dehydrogenase
VNGRPRHVIVVGGGVAGLCTAYYLRRQDVEVTLVEAATIGSPVASSFGNGGWICPAQAGPLPDAGLTIHGFRALLNRDSSLYFDPRYLPRLVPWLLRFWTYCNPRDFESGTRALATLGRRVFELVDELLDSKLVFELHKLGMIVVGTERQTIAAVQTKLAPMRRYGYTIPERLLEIDELHALEPSLAPRVRTGLLIEEQWHVRADSFTTSLGQAVAKMGVRTVENVRITGFATSGGRVRAVTSADGDVAGDAFVLCAGSWTGLLARRLGGRIPLQPGKGYTFILDADPAPRHGLLFPDLHAGATPLQGGVRIGGTMEFAGFDRTVDHRRVQTLFHGARDFLNVTNAAPRDEWAGLRPMTVDGLPVIDRLAGHDNAYIATGYSMLGMTLALPAAEALTAMIVGGDRPSVLAPFRADRFPRFVLRRPRDHEPERRPLP